MIGKAPPLPKTFPQEVTGVYVDLTRASDGRGPRAAYPVAVSVVPAVELRPLRGFDASQPAEQHRQTAMLAKETPRSIRDWLGNLAVELDVVNQLGLSASIALAYLHRVSVATEYLETLLAEVLGAERRSDDFASPYGMVHGIWWGALDSLAIVAGRDLVRRCHLEIAPLQVEGDRREIAGAGQEGYPHEGMNVIHQGMVAVANSMQRLLNAASAESSHPWHFRAALSLASSAAAELNMSMAGTAGGRRVRNHWRRGRDPFDVGSLVGLLVVH